MLEKVTATEADGPAKFKVTRTSGKNVIYPKIGGCCGLSGHFGLLSVYTYLCSGWGLGKDPVSLGDVLWCILSELLQGCEFSAIPRCQEPGQMLLQPLASASRVFAWALAASSLKS